MGDETKTQQNCIFYNVGNFSEELATIKLDGKWGFVNKLGTEIIPLQYDNVNEIMS